MIILSHISHIDDTVTIMVTSHKITKKNIKGFGRMTLYNKYNI